MAAHRWPWGRIVVGIVVAVILLFSIPLFFTSADIRRRADKARTAELMRLKVDLSKPGVYSGTFNHDFEAAHGNYVQIVTNVPSASYEQAEAIVEGLVGHLAVTGFDQQGGYEQEFGPKDYDCMRADDGRWAPVVRFHCSTAGNYRLKFTVGKGAPKLAGIPQALVVRYEICGLEYLVANLACLLGIAGCTVAGVIILLIVIVTMKKRHSSTRTPSAG